MSEPPSHKHGWEPATKVRIGKSGELGWQHRDPFDRMLAARRCSTTTNR